MFKNYFSNNSDKLLYKLFNGSNSHNDESEIDKLTTGHFFKLAIPFLMIFLIGAMKSLDLISTNILRFCIMSITVLFMPYLVILDTIRQKKVDKIRNKSSSIIAQLFTEKKDMLVLLEELETIQKKHQIIELEKIIYELKCLYLENKVMNKETVEKIHQFVKDNYDSITSQKINIEDKKMLFNNDLFEMEIGSIKKLL